MTALSRARSKLDVAWRSFVIDGRLSQAVKPEILRSWQRARAEWRIDPALRRSLLAFGSDELLAGAVAEEALRIASPLVKEVAEGLAGGGHVVAYCDAEGMVLDLQGNRRTCERLAEINLVPGGCWSEHEAGTNGIGTALIERRPVEVFASEHFVEAWQYWNCASVPIQVGDSLVGVVDITSPWTARHPSLLVCAESLARGIECRLEAAAAQRAEIVRRELFERGGASGWLAIDLHGQVVGTGPAVKLAGCDLGALRMSQLGGVLAQLRHTGAGQEFQQVIEVAGRPMRVVCNPVIWNGRTVGGVLRIASAPQLRGRTGPAAARRRRYEFEDILGDSPALLRQIALGRAAARNALPVLIQGESGTGKEMFAQAIHFCGDRATGPFIPLNCGSIAQSLLEAEFFGYEPGSFTGGRKEGSPGRFEDADGGTLFLDEVTELSAPGQLALLRILQEREVTRIGSSRPRPVDVRVIAASNKNLRHEVDAGRFRQDLFFRLNVLSVEPPPLRSRREDLPRLADHYLSGAQIEVRRCGLVLSRAAMAALASYDWPGNVRELRNVLERAVVVAAGPEILVSDLPPDVQAVAQPDEADVVARDAHAAIDSSTRPGEDRDRTSPDAERASLELALERSAWNVVRAARLLGISRRTMYRKLEKHGLARG